MTVETKDGLSIKATFYPGTAKKEAVPIIMIHGWEGQKGDFDGLASYLQTLGHASIVPDLRGHGQSKLQKRADGSAVTLDTEKLNRAAIEEMVLDVEACKKFLLEKNNAGELNIEQLCVIGAEFGSVLAMKWSCARLERAQLPGLQAGTRRQGALVLLSPLQAFKGLTVRDALAHLAVQTQLSMMFIAGTKDTKSAGEAKQAAQCAARAPSQGARG